MIIAPVSPATHRVAARPTWPGRRARLVLLALVVGLFLAIAVGNASVAGAEESHGLSGTITFAEDMAEYPPLDCNHAIRCHGSATRRVTFRLDGREAEPDPTVEERCVAPLCSYYGATATYDYQSSYEEYVLCPTPGAVQRFITSGSGTGFSNKSVFWHDEGAGQYSLELTGGTTKLFLVDAHYWECVGPEKQTLKSVVNPGLNAGGPYAPIPFPPSTVFPRESPDGILSGTEFYHYQGEGGDHIQGHVEVTWRLTFKADRDHDGFPDATDACPDTYAPPDSTNGCPPKEEQKEKEQKEKELKELEERIEEEEREEEKGGGGPSTQNGGGNESGPTIPHPCSGDPVTDATGNFFESQTDLSVGGRGVGLDLTRTYNSQDGAKGMHGPFGYGWSSSFGDHLAVDREHKKAILYQGNGSTVPFTERGDGSFTPAGWTQDALSGSSESGYTLTRADQRKYRFAADSGRLESVTDRNGNTTTVSYDGSGRLESITDPAGRKVTLGYNGEGLVEDASDPMGHIVKYAYHNGDLASVTEPGETAPRWRFQYDGSHQITGMTDGRGGTTHNEYDAFNRVVAQHDPAGRTLTWEYRPLETRTTDATGSVTDEHFNGEFAPTSITCGLGTADATTRSFSYDSRGSLTSVTDGNGHATKYGYDSVANRTSLVDADNNETKWTYNGTHDVISTTAPSGEVTTIARDSHGNAESISRPAPGGQSQATKYAYDSHGELASVIDPLGRVSTYEYDSQGDRTSATDPEGDKRTWTYDQDSRMTSTVSPRGNVKGAKAGSFTSKTDRDAQGRVIALTDPLKHVARHTYDPNGNVASATDANGDVTRYTYDADNEQIRVTQPTGAVIETGYDSAGRVSSQTDGNKHTTTYVRNVLGRVTEAVDALGRKSTREYDLAGNLTSVKDPGDRTTSYAYDAANRLKQINVLVGTESTAIARYTYDVDGNRTTMVDGTGASAYTYDQLDRLTEAKDGHGAIVKYGYDLADEQTSITYPNDKAVSRAYDKAGRLQKVTDWSGRTTQFSYDRDSDLQATTFPATTGNEDNYTFDGAGQMSAAKMMKGSRVLASLLYTRDRDGQLETTTGRGLPGEDEIRDKYDPNRRLTKGGTVAYKYDPANNPIKIDETSYSYDSANQLVSGKGLKYTYDALGERTKRTPTSGPATSYGYDKAGNLASVSRPKGRGLPAITDAYAYNGDGLRTSQTTGGTTSYLTWDNETVPFPLNDGQYSYVYGPDGLAVEQISDSGAAKYLHHDQQGSTRLLTGAGGKVEAAWTYDAYGNLIASTGTQTTPLGYDGQYTNADSGLIYLRARTYDPATAQFLTPDPIEAISRARYAYASSNPTTYQDNTGLLFGSIGASIGGFLEEHTTLLAGLEGYSNFGAGFLNDSLHGVLDIGAPFCGPGLDWSYKLGELGSQLYGVIDGLKGLKEGAEVVGGGGGFRYTSGNPWSGVRIQ